MTSDAPYAPLRTTTPPKASRLIARRWGLAGTGDEPPPRPDSPEGTASEPGKQPLRILIIEDNRDYAEGLQLFLELFGHEVTVAYTGTEGVEAALRMLPQVVLCDIGLPGLDGYEVARLLRANPLTANVHLIAVTGYGSERDRQRAAESGFDAHLVKPVEAAEILKLIGPQ